MRASSVPPRAPRGRAPDHPSTWNRVLGTSLAIAVLLHVALFLLWPRMHLPDPAPAFREAPLYALTLPEAPAPDLPEVGAVAPAPAASRAAPPRPPAPLELHVGELRIPLRDLREPVTGSLEPPSLPPQGDQWAAYRPFTPAMVRPEIRNRRAMQRFLQNHYTPLLDATGVTGVVGVRFWIDEEGTVQRAEVAVSSGSPQLDELALELGGILEFRPAVQGGMAIAVQVQLPITFRSA